MKAWLGSGLMVLLLVFMSACGGTTSGGSGTGEGADANGSEASPSNEAPADEAAETGASPDQEAEDQEAASFPDRFELKDTLVFPGLFEITLVSNEFTTKVSPSNPGQFHTYYEVKEPDKVYIHSTFRVKNVSGSSLGADDILTLKAKYDGQYDYTGFDTVEEVGGSDLTYTNITSIAPLSTRTMHYLIEVPKEVQDSGKSIEYALTADGKTFTTTAEAEGGNALVVAEERPLTDKTEWQSYEQWQLSEMSAVEGYAEITPELAELTTAVKPPNPGMFHTYYEVKDPGSIYAHLAVSFKNVMNIGKGADEALEVGLIYDNKYEYRSFSAVEEDGGSNFTYANITKIDPLTSEKIHYMVELPAEAADNDADIVFVIQANGNKYYLQMPR